MNLPLQFLFSWVDITLALLMATVVLILNKMEPKSRNCSQTSWEAWKANLSQHHMAVLIFRRPTRPLAISDINCMVTGHLQVENSVLWIVLLIYSVLLYHVLF